MGKLYKLSGMNKLRFWKFYTSLPKSHYHSSIGLMYVEYCNIDEHVVVEKTVPRWNL